MSKITVKHYVNDKVNQKNGLYPVYFRLTYQQKHNFLKSFTDLYLPKDFNISYSGLGFNDIVRIIESDNRQGEEIISLKITREKLEIEKAIELLTLQNESKEYERKGIKAYLKGMFEPLEKILIKGAWEITLEDLGSENDKEYYEFYTMFDKKLSIGEIIYRLDSVIFEFAKRNNLVKQSNLFYGSIGTELFRKEHSELWGNIQFVLNVIYLYEPLVIDWFLTDFKKEALLEQPKMSKQDINRTISLIELIIKRQSIT